MALLANREMILMELQQQAEEYKLSITVRTMLSGEELSSLSWLVFAAVETLIKDWYNISVTAYVSCSHCLSLGFAKPSMFLLEECQQAATMPNRSFFYCTQGGE